MGDSSCLEDRPEWNDCRKVQRAGDELVIPSLDRVAGSDTIAISVICENTRRGIDHARSWGRVGGRPTVMTPERIAMAKTMRESTPPMSYEQIVLALGVGRSSVSRALSKPE